MNSILSIRGSLSTAFMHFVAKPDTNNATARRGPLLRRGTQHDAAASAAPHPEPRHPQVDEGLCYADLLRLR